MGEWLKEVSGQDFDYGVTPAVPANSHPADPGIHSPTGGVAPKFPGFGPRLGPRLGPKLGPKLGSRPGPRLGPGTSERKICRLSKGCSKVYIMKLDASTLTTYSVRRWFIYQQVRA